MKAKDTQAVTAADNADVVVLTRDEYESLMRLADGPQPNLTPAVEEGPHLRKKDVREAKVKQLQEAHDLGALEYAETGLTDDMRELISEAGV